MKGGDIFLRNGLSAEILDRLQQIEQVLNGLAQKSIEKDYYTIAETALVLDRATFTVREWARLHRIRASKRRCGRGNSKEWIISREELVRIRNEGLLPRERKSNTEGRVAQ
jgi:hypothetical protein